MSNDFNDIEDQECNKNSKCPRCNIFENMSDEEINNLFSGEKDKLDQHYTLSDKAVEEMTSAEYIDTPWTTGKTPDEIIEKIAEIKKVKIPISEEEIKDLKALSEPFEFLTPSGGIKAEYLTDINKEDIPSGINYGKCGGIKNDMNKPQLSLVPMQMLRDAALARMYGNNKYKDVPGYSTNNWCTIDKQRVIDALLRHILLYLEDMDGVDKESGLPHLCHVAANLAFLCEMQQSNWEEKKAKIIANDPILNKNNTDL